MAQQAMKWKFGTPHDRTQATLRTTCASLWVKLDCVAEKATKAGLGQFMDGLRCKDF